MTTNVAIIGLGIMGTRMLQHMRKHQEFNPTIYGTLIQLLVKKLENKIVKLK